MAHALEAVDQQAPTIAGRGPHRSVGSTLALEFDRGSSGHTILVRSEQQPPLRVVRSFQLADGSALAHLHNVSGGLLGGDALTLSVHVRPRAQVQLTTTGATRIYRPRPTIPPATQRSHVRVGENALLEYLPDAIIPFAGSRFVQETTIELSAGAGLFWWEIVAPGREARGEMFQYESVEMKLDLLVEEQLAAAERLRLVPRERPIESRVRLGPFRYWASFCICRVGLHAANWIRIEQKLREEAAQFVSSGPALWGVSALPAHGVAVRCLAMQGRDAVGGLHLLWNAAKQLLYNRQAIRPRKMN
jgi:urease accessory protein